MNWLIILCAVAAFFIWRPYLIESVQSGSILLPDLSFHLECKGKDRSALENDIEKFLSIEGFRVLNRGRIQREHNVFLFDTDIIGLDDKQNIVDLIKMPNTESRYAMSLTSFPPTQHYPQLEKALLAYAKEKLKCEIRQVRRNQNGPEAIEFHNNEVKRIEGLFRQAEELQGRRRI
jgi:hypothetical protein